MADDPAMRLWEASEDDPPLRYFPGTDEVIPDDPPAPFDLGGDDEEDRWDADPALRKWLRIGDDASPTELFLTGALAKALNRKPVTIRLWERKGWIPAATYRTPKVGQVAGKRLYTRPQVEGLRGIAREEGLLDSFKSVDKTDFTARAYRLFAYLTRNNIN